MGVTLNHLGYGQNRLSSSARSWEGAGHDRRHPCTPVMISYFFSGAVTGLAVAMPIGAVGSYLVGLAARERTVTAIAAALGIASVEGGDGILAAAGGTGLQTMLSEGSGWLTHAGGVNPVVGSRHH